MSYPVCSFVTEKAQQWIVDILAALEARPMAALELSLAIGLPRRTLERYLRNLHCGAPKRIFICGVEKRQRGQHAPVFAVGAAPDLLDVIVRSQPSVDIASAPVVTSLAAIYDLPPADPWLAWIPRRDEMREAA